MYYHEVSRLTYVISIKRSRLFLALPTGLLITLYLHLIASRHHCKRRTHPQLTAPVLTVHSVFKLDKEIFLPSMGEQLVMRGTLKGHSGWVTSLATSLEKLVKKKY